jgi:ferrochelatase
MNTGSPSEPSTEVLNHFLAEVEKENLVDLPWPIRAMLTKVARHHNNNPAHLTEAYHAVWSGNVSPMVHYCSRLASELEEKIGDPVVPGMLYGHPSYKGAIEQLLTTGVDEICLLPLFAQYALATVGACVARVEHELKKCHSDAGLRVVSPFFNHPAYIEALATTVKQTDEHILFSYHGYPLRHLKKADPTQCHCLTASTCCSEPSLAHYTCYRFQCLMTSREIAKAADLPDGSYSTSFQSHTDNEKWMEPHTKDKLRQLPAMGGKRLAVVCPALFCDCLETLEEIEIRGKEIFRGAGGESLRMIPSLNDTPAAIDCLETLMANANSWPIELELVLQ